MDGIIEHAPCGFLSFADSGEILATNTTLAEILGYDSHELDGLSIRSIFTVGAVIFYQTHLFPLLKLHGKAEEMYLSLKSKDGQNIPVFANVVRRVEHEDAVNDCIFMVMRQRSRYEDEIIAARKAAEQATREKAKAYEELNTAHTQLEEQAVELELQTTELELQTTELEAQQDELIRLNTELQNDLIARRKAEAQLRAAVAREGLINDIGRAVRESTSIEAIQQTAVTRLSQALQTDRCFFTQYDPAHDRAWIDLDWKRPDLPSLAGDFRMSDRDIDLGKLYTPNATLVIADIDNDTRIAQNAVRALRSVGLRSVVGVGLFDKDQLVATVTAGMAEEARNWTFEDVALVQAVATQVRSAMEMARVRQRERNIANQLQEALQPTRTDQALGLTIDTFYRPALDEAEIGGDFYDVFHLTQDCYALVVADVSGKGLEAAAQIASVRHMLRALLYQQNTTLAESVMALNNMLASHDLLSGFATLFVGLYDAKLSCMDYVSCGQEPGLIRRAATGDVEYLNPTGPVLGGFAGVRFTQKSVDLAEGDVLALFTDGLTEAGTQRTNMLGMEGVEAIFRDASNGTPAPKAITSRVMKMVLDRVTPAGLRDDICLLVARVGNKTSEGG